MLGGLIGKEVAQPIEAVGNVLDKLFTSDAERETLKLAKERLYARASEVQAEINKVEAGHRSIFIAGWRPFIGWVCGFALAWHFMIYDILQWIAAIQGWQTPPQLSGTGQLISIVLSLLGLGSLRTFEKSKGVSK